MNSLLQALSGSPTYMSYVESIIENKMIPDQLPLSTNKPTPNTIPKTNTTDNTLDILRAYILILLQLQAKDHDADPSVIYKMLCEDGEFTRMYEECDAHELNLYFQDKLLDLVPRSVRRYLKR